MKPAALLKVLKKQLGYREDPGHRAGGSHRQFRAEGLPTLTWAFHSGDEIPPFLVRKILTKDIGLTDAVAERLLGLRR